MEYSNLTSMSRGLVLPSPSSGLVAAANGNCLDVYDLDALSLLHTTTAADSIVHLTWGSSPTFGEVLAASSSPSNSVIVVRVDTGEVVVDVHDSPIAIAGLELTSGGYLLIRAEHGLSLTIVAVDSARRIAVLPFVKSLGPHGMLHAISPDDRFVAVVTRKDGIDGVCLVSLSTGRKVMARRGAEQLAGVGDVAGILWKSVGLIFWGGPADLRGHHALSLMSCSGRVLMSGDPASQHAFRMDFEGTEASGLLIDDRKQWKRADDAKSGCELGIKTATANLDGTLIAVGGCDGALRVINTNLWLQVASFGHEKPEVDDIAPPVIFRERTKVISDSELVEQDRENSSRVGNGIGHGLSGQSSEKIEVNHSSYFEVLCCNGSVEITKRVRSTSAPHPTKFGVSFAQFSPCGGYLASRCDRAGNVVFVWDVKNLRLFALLIFEGDARCIRWSRPEASSWKQKDIKEAEGADGDESAQISAAKRDCDGESDDDEDESVGSQLAVVTGGEYVYLWRRSGAAAVRVRPAHKWRGEFEARKVAWAHANKALVVADGVSAKAFLAVYPV